MSAETWTLIVPSLRPRCSPLPELANLPPAEVAARRRSLGIRVSGFDVPAPVQTFGQAGVGRDYGAALAW